MALQDGWAVVAEETLGASPYAPAFTTIPPKRVAFGDILPDFADAVLPLPNVGTTPNSFEILSSAAPGEGVRARGGDLAEVEVIVPAGRKLELLHLALLRLAGVESIAVRIPRVRILHQCDVGSWLEAMVEQEGAHSIAEPLAHQSVEQLVASLVIPDADFIIAIGTRDTRDAVIRAVGSLGEMLFRNVALLPGQGICCGTIFYRSGPESVASSNSSEPTPLPVLFIPNRMECVLTAWLLFVQPSLRELAGSGYHDIEVCLPLARKITSAPGLSELALVRRVTNPNDKTMLWEPLATGDITISAIANADAWLLVAAESEGYAAGQSVSAKLL